MVTKGTYKPEASTPRDTLLFHEFIAGCLTKAKLRHEEFNEEVAITQLQAVDSSRNTREWEEVMQGDYIGQCTLCKPVNEFDIFEPNEANGRCPSCLRKLFSDCAVPFKEPRDKKCNMICHKCFNEAEAQQNVVIIRQANNDSSMEDLRMQC